MKRALVVGALGQLGAALIAEGKRRGIVTLGAARKPGSDIIVDLESAATQDRIFDANPDVIFLAAGYTFVDKGESEPERVARVNAVAPAEIAKRAEGVGIPVVFYSTDYVFDGTAPQPYREDDAPNPLSVYGRTKLAGERAVLAASPKNLVLRTSVVFGFDANEKNFVYQTLRAAKEGRKLSIATDQRANPTYNPELAWASFELATRGEAGIFHAVGPESLLRPQFGALICDVFGLRAADVYEEKPTSAFNQPAKRPLNGSLDQSKLTQTLGRSLSSPRASLEAFKNLIRPS